MFMTITCQGFQKGDANSLEIKRRERKNKKYIYKKKIKQIYQNKLIKKATFLVNKKEKKTMKYLNKMCIYICHLSETTQSDQHPRKWLI